MGDSGLDLYCTNDGTKLFSNRPELYEKRIKEIRELRAQHYREEIFPCRYCGTRIALDGEPYCSFCGHRTYPMRWDERAYTEHLRRLRARN